MKMEWAGATKIRKIIHPGK